MPGPRRPAPTHGSGTASRRRRPPRNAPADPATARCRRTPRRSVRPRPRWTRSRSRAPSGPSPTISSTALRDPAQRSPAGHGSGCPGPCGRPAGTPTAAPALRRARTGPGPSAWRPRSGRKVSTRTPGGRYSSAALGPRAAEIRRRAYWLTKVMTSLVRPIRRSARRAPGTIDQPTSCPCVLATVRVTPSARSAGVSRLSGAAAPYQTAPIRWSRTSSAARRRTASLGQHQRSGMPEDRKGLPRIEFRVTGPGRRVDDQFARRQPLGERLHVGLDATGAGRKVVGHQQRSPHGVGPNPSAAQVAANGRSPVRIDPDGSSRTGDLFGSRRA